MYNIFQDIQNYYTSRTIEPSKLFIEKIMRVTGPSKVCNKMTICQRLEVVQELTETMFKNYQGCSLSNMEGAQSWREVCHQQSLGVDSVIICILEESATTISV